jgi:uncharacterized protein (UPF0335 family)
LTHECKYIIIVATEGNGMGEERINNLEEDIRELRADFKETSKDVTAIREKIFDGFDKTVTEIHEEVIELRKLHSAVNEIKQNNAEDVRLSTCPFRKEVTKKMMRRFYIVATLATISISAVSIVTSVLLR